MYQKPSLQNLTAQDCQAVSGGAYRWQRKATNWLADKFKQHQVTAATVFFPAHDGLNASAFAPIINPSPSKD